MDMQIMASMVPGGNSMLAFNKWAGRAMPIVEAYTFVLTMRFGGAQEGGLEGAAEEGAVGAAAKIVPDVENLSNKIVRQMVTRGWTKQEILDTVNAGKAFPVVNKATGGAATEYVSASGKFVVVDNATKQVIQVSGPGFLPNHMAP
jgi:hypothetical protein